MPSMRWASVSATEHTLNDAVAQAADRLLAALDGTEPDLVMAWVSNRYGVQFTTLPGLLRREFDTAQLFGCLGSSVIGGGHEMEGAASIALMGAVLPGTELRAIHLEHHALPPTYAERSLWDTALGLRGTQPECMLLLVDPFSFDTEALLKGLDRIYSHAVKFGGLISGIEQSGTPCMLLNDRIYASGCICLAMSGNLAVDTVVAQGCRPIGEPLFANATHENLILELDGKVPREVLTDLYQRIKRNDRQLFTDALFIGLATEPQRERYGAGDFLVRTILGLDPDSGALLVNTHVPAHSVVQLHLRDALTSAQELEQLFSRYRTNHDTSTISAAILLSCLGRGAEFYGQSDHDSNAFKQHLADVPLAGFFCNGEIGPVHNLTHLHSYTSVFAIFRHKG